jgi:hypothetical protein
MSLEGNNHNTNNNWRLNIPIGSRIIIDDHQDIYIFYGYNHDQSRASCFPSNSSCMIDKMIFIPISAILSIYKEFSNTSYNNCNSDQLEKRIENCKI